MTHLRDSLTKERTTPLPPPPCHPSIHLFHLAARNPLLPAHFRNPNIFLFFLSLSFSLSPFCNFPPEPPTVEGGESYAPLLPPLPPPLTGLLTGLLPSVICPISRTGGGCCGRLGCGLPAAGVGMGVGMGAGGSRSNRCAGALGGGRSRGMSRRRLS